MQLRAGPPEAAAPADTAASAPNATEENATHASEAAGGATASAPNATGSASGAVVQEEKPLEPLEVIKLGEGGFALSVLRRGDQGTFPRRGDNVTVHYTGKLASSGKVFDSSRERGEPLTFKIGKGKVIRGWDQGIVEMSLGERGILRVPAYKAYGTDGAGEGAIPPNSDLDFDVELLAVNGQKSEELKKWEEERAAAAPPAHSGARGRALAAVAGSSLAALALLA